MNQQQLTILDTPEQVKEYETDPKKYLAYRKAMESEMSGGFDIVSCTRVDVHVSNAEISCSL